MTPKKIGASCACKEYFDLAHQTNFVDAYIVSCCNTRINVFVTQCVDNFLQLANKLFNYYRCVNACPRIQPFHSVVWRVHTTVRHRFSEIVMPVRIMNVETSFELQIKFNIRQIIISFVSFAVKSYIVVPREFPLHGKFSVRRTVP